MAVSEDMERESVSQILRLVDDLYDFHVFNIFITIKYVYNGLPYDKCSSFTTPLDFILCKSL